MIRSDKVTHVLGKLAKARPSFQPVFKTERNEHFKSRYADLAGYLDAIRDGLAAFGLELIQATRMAGDDGLILDTTLFDIDSGEYIGCEYPLRPEKPTPQGLGSAITYARRYSIAALLNLAQEDDDGHQASQPRREERKPEQRPAAPAKSAPSTYSEWLPASARKLNVSPEFLRDALIRMAAKKQWTTLDAPADILDECLAAKWASDRQEFRSVCQDIAASRTKVAA
ncbi:Essential recombination function protein [uncultured Caudovirales phage]|uniref:Essential recombination function protein n=1 Tax=uncultured Caudovirales phage TaxID=2100421 RepID=A0A6J5L998_9CAUD|nr:Essential recombination function protein [uncultured Caudovirales phage]